MDEDVDIEACTDAQQRILAVLNGLNEIDAVVVTQHVIASLWLGVRPDMPLPDFLKAFGEGVLLVNSQRRLDA